VVTGASLSRDIADAHALKDDFGALLRDAEDHRNDWKILYAVDFAEIHSYVVPDDEQRLSIFRDDDEIVGRTVHDNALHRILFDTPPVLLSPYLLELDNFLNKFDPRTFAKVVNAVSRLVVHAKRLAALPEFAAAHAAVEQFRISESSEKALEELRSFIESNAALLAAMKTLDAMSPPQRLKKLLGSGFVDIEEHAGVTIVPDEDFYVRWRAALDKSRKKRDPGSNRLDALAVAFVKSSNEQLAPQKIKVRLVTRSLFMHKQMKREVKSGYWPDPPLRNPRCFGAFVDDWKSPEAFTALTSLLTSVEAFLDSAEGLSPTAAKIAGENDPVRQHFDRLKADWRNAFDLAIIARQSSAPSVTPSEAHEFVELMNVVNRSQRLRSVLANVSREMYGEIPKTYQLLGLLVHGRDAAMRKVFEESVASIEPTREADTVVLSSTQDNVPYRLEFYSDELRNWGALFAGKALDWSAITNFFIDALDSKAGDYEVLLALAYLLCATGNWAATEKYCRLALAEPDAQANPSEGLFLLAFALRRQTANLSRYEESLTVIDAAIKAKLGGARGPADPRYVKEKATLLLLWWRRYRGYGGQVADPSFRPPAISESFALQMFDDALAHPDADDDLKAQIYNNLTMMMLYRGDAASLDAARGYLHLLKELRPIDGDVWRGSALILDTIIWGGWRLGECAGYDELMRQVRKLERAAESRGISAEERAQIRDHIRQMTPAAPPA